MGFRRTTAGTTPEPDDGLEALRAQAAISMDRARRMASEDPIERAAAQAEVRAENATLFASGQRRPSLVGWYRGPGDPEHVERYWDGQDWTELTRDLSAPVPVPDLLPFEGEIVWLTAEQGGPPSGAPTLSAAQPYRAYAHVPPSIAAVATAPFVLRGIGSPSADWRSPACAGWLTIDGTGPGSVRAGALIVVTDGTAPIGYFTVAAVLEPVLEPADEPVAWGSVRS